MRSPKTDRDGIIFKQRPVDTILRLTSLHIYTCIKIERITIDALGVFYGVIQEPCFTPVVIKEERCCRLAIFTEVVVVVCAEALVKHDRSLVIRAIVPHVFKDGVLVLHFFIQGNVELTNSLSRSIATAIFRVVAKAIYTVIVEELSSFVCTSLAHLFQTFLPRIGQRTIRDAGDRSDCHTILVGCIQEGSRNATEWCRPVAPVVNVVPHGKDFAVENAIGQSVGLRVIYRNPSHKTLVNGGIDAQTHLCGIVAEVLARFHARDEEVVVF